MNLESVAFPCEQPPLLTKVACTTTEGKKNQAKKSLHFLLFPPDECASLPSSGRPLAEADEGVAAVPAPLAEPDEGRLVRTLAEPNVTALLRSSLRTK